MAETGSLLRRTRSLLEEALKSGLTLRDIASSSDGKVLFDWLRKVSENASCDPSVNRTEALHDCLVKLRSKRKKS